MSNEAIKKTIAEEYKYGFETNVEQDTFSPGLDEQVIKRLSEKKNEPKSSFFDKNRLGAWRKYFCM